MQAWKTWGIFPRAGRQRTGESMAATRLVELSTTSYPARTRRNIEESDGTVIFSLEHRLSGGTKLTLELASKLEKPV
jgi:Circularly permutated YpsA SLOG family